MARKQKSDDRYVLLLDLLGFSARIKAGEAKTCVAAVNRMLDQAVQWTPNSSDFRFLYFSDTIIVYTKAAGRHAEWYSDLVFVGSRIVVHLLQSKWAVRGALAFGEFIVGKVGTRPVTFVGKALVEAHEAEQKRKALGFVVLPSALAAAGISTRAQATSYYANEGIGLVEPSGWFVPNFLTSFHGSRREELDFNLNKFADSSYSPEPIEGPWFEPDMQAVQFIYQEMRKFEALGGVHVCIALKYRNTWELFRKLLGRSLYSNVTSLLGIEDSEADGQWTR